MKRPTKPPPADSKFISASQLREHRYAQRSHMWLVRLLKNDPDFPRPVWFGKMRFFEVAALEAYERSRVAAGGKVRNKKN